MTAVAKQIVLPPDVYDALELSTIAHGPIGYGMYYRFVPGESSCPHCIHGHARSMDPECEISATLDKAGVSERLNDSIVSPDERISWDEFCRRGNIVRGEDQ